MRPQILVPVHGEKRHLREQARFALSQGVPKAMVQENGDIIRLAPKGPKKVGVARVGRLVLDGDVILPADGSTINERRKIGVNGLITVALAVDRSGKLLGDPLVRPFGIPVEEDRDDFLADATDTAARAYSPGAPEEKMRDAVRLAVRRCATLWTGKKPMVDVTVLSVSQ
jgi:ribonuclease J